MDKKTAKLQKDAADMQTELGGMVIRTNSLLEEIRSQKDKEDKQSVSFFKTKVHIQLMQYQTLMERMEKTAGELAFCVDEKKEQEESLLVSVAMLRQLIVQAGQEQQNLTGIMRTIELWDKAVRADAKTEDILMLDQFKKVLKESGKPHG